MAATSKWHELPMIAVDTETTGTNPLDARVVTAAVVHLTPGQRPRAIQWLIDPGVDVPDEAANVHGWTTDRIATTIGRPGWAIRSLTDSTGKPQATRIPADVALYEIAGQIAAVMGDDRAVIVHNAAYDLTLLETEFARHNVPTLTTRPTGITGVVDPMVIEKQYDAFRKVCYRKASDGTTCDREAGVHVCGGCRGGKYHCGGCGALDRKLESLCTHYGIRHAGAHDAAADAVAAARLARKLMEAWPATARLKLSTLHEHQVTWRREQSDSLRSFWKKNADDRWREVDSGWPLHSAPSTALVGA